MLAPAPPPSLPAGLARPHLDLVYATALREARNDHALAADVTQAVLMLHLRKKPDLAGPALAAWLHRAARYVAANARRSEARRKRHEQAAAELQVCAPAPPPDLRWDLDGALDRLPASDRALLISHYLQGAPYADLATALKLDEPAVRKRLSRALGRLRQFLSRPHAPVTRAGTLALLQAEFRVRAPEALTAPPTPAAHHLLRYVVMKTTVAKTTAAIAVLLLLATLGYAGREFLRHDPLPSAPPSANDAVAAAQPAPFNAVPAGAAVMSDPTFVRDAANLRTIGQWLYLSTRQSNRAFPHTLGDAVLARPAASPDRARADMAMFLTPDELERNPPPDKLDPEWVNAHTSYVYLAPDLDVGKLPSDAPVLYNPVPLTDGAPGFTRTRYNVLFADGHVEGATEEHLKQLIPTATTRPAR